MSYPGEAFTRLKAKNPGQLESLRRTERITVLLPPTVTAIFPERVELKQNGIEVVLANDAVIVSVGGLLWFDLLKSVGIHFETQFEQAPL